MYATHMLYEAAGCPVELVKRLINQYQGDADAALAALRERYARVKEMA